MAQRNNLTSWDTRESQSRHRFSTATHRIHQSCRIWNSSTTASFINRGRIPKGLKSISTFIRPRSSIFR